MFGFAGCGKGGGARGEFGHGPFGHFKHQENCGPGALMEELNLTDEQVEKVAELKSQGFAQFAQMKLTFGEMIKRLSHELLTDNIDPSRVKAVFDDMKTKKAEAADAFSDRLIKFAEILTVEQRKKLKALLLRKFVGLDWQSQGS